MYLQALAKSALSTKITRYIEELLEKTTDTREDILSFEEFLNIVNNAGKLLRAADVGLKDRIARLIYLNMCVDNENVADYRMREPFNTYLKAHKS